MKRVRRIAKRAPLSDQLDQALETIMTDREAALPRVNSRIAAILRIASDLRDLPTEDFKARLKNELQARAHSAKSGSYTASRTSYIPQGSHSATACLVVKDPGRAIEFYKQAFGASELMSLKDPSGNVMHASIKIGDSPIEIAPEYPGQNLSPQSLGGTSAIVKLYVEDVDAFANRAIEAGAKVMFPVADQFYGDRSGRLADPFGHLWIVSTHKEDVTMEEMEERAAAWMSAQPSSTGESRAEKIDEGTRPEGFHSITPYFQVEGAAKFIDFLERAFGAEEIMRVPRPESDLIAHAQLKLEGSMIELADATAEFKANPTAMWLFVGDADAMYKRAIKAGATTLHKPVDQDYGDREASVKDPFGNHWYIATHREDAEPLPEEVRSVTPFLHPIGSGAVIDFMKQAFGAEEVFRAQDPAGTVHHAKVRIGDSIIAMGDAHEQWQPMPPALHLYVNDADLAYHRAIDAGATSVYAPSDAPYGDRGAGVRDPFDNVWYIATHKKDAAVEDRESQNAELAPQQRPGAIMPFMYSEDAAGAAELYKRVFGATEVHRIVQPGGKVSHVQIAIGETNVMLRNATTDDLAEYIEKGFARTPRQLGGTPLHLYIYVADANTVFKRAIEAGSQVVDPIEDKDWGDRCGGVKDPFGHIWYIATPLRYPRGGDH